MVKLAEKGLASDADLRAERSELLSCNEASVKRDDHLRIVLEDRAMLSSHLRPPQI